MNYRKVISGFLMGLGVASVSVAQEKPAESTTKIKKVLRFYKVGPGEYIHQDGQRDLAATLQKLSQEKGFELVNLNNDAAFSADYLSQFQVAIWDNNVNAGTSVGSNAARTAVINWVNNGGGWLLVHGAGDHKDTWPQFSAAIQTKFSEHGSQGPADLVMDPEGLAHKELKWMMKDWPSTVRFTRDEWYSFQNSVRGRDNMVVVATAKNGGNGVLRPVGDGSNDHTYIFAKAMEKGRVMYTAMGHGGNEFYSQADGFAVEALWDNMRYVAGDFQNGCTDPQASNHDSTARVDDGSCQVVGIGDLGMVRASNLEVSFPNRGQDFKMDFAFSGSADLKIHDVTGKQVWAQSIRADEPAQIRGVQQPGIYFVTAKSGEKSARMRIRLD